MLSNHCDNNFTSQAETLRLELKNLINKYSFLKDLDSVETVASNKIEPQHNMKKVESENSLKRLLPSLPFRKRSLTENLTKCTLASKYLQSRLGDETPLIETSENRKRPSIASILFMSSTPSTHFNDCSCDSESTPSTVPCTQDFCEARSIDSNSSHYQVKSEARRSSIKSNDDDASSAPEVVALFKRVGKLGKVTFKDVADDASDTSDNASATGSDSLANSTEYSGMSDRYNHPRHRDAPRRSTQEHPSQELREPLDDHHHHHHSHHHHREGSVKKGRFTRSLSNTEVPSDERTGTSKTSDKQW